MAHKRRSVGLVAGSAISLGAAFALVACGNGDDHDDGETVIVEQGDGGAGSVTVSYPPALGPEDCVATTSKIKLSQPKGAAVWGGIVLLEFEVEGARVDSFDVQAFDPAIDGWLSTYVNVEVQGQRDDGTYFMVLRPNFSEPNRDSELKLRVRPAQTGCPEGEWTETPTFTAGDPISGTSWKATIPGELFSSTYFVTRTTVPGGEPLPQTKVALGDATVSVEYGDKGAFTQVVTLPLIAAEDEPFHDCSISLTFEGTYALVFRRTSYYGVWLTVSDQQLTGADGTCELPVIEDLLISAESTDMHLNAYTQGVDIDYLPLLYSEPARWSNAGPAQVFTQLPPFLSYETSDETGSVAGYLYAQDVVFEQQ